MANHTATHATAGGLRLDYDEFQYPRDSPIAAFQLRSRLRGSSEQSIVICYSGQLRGFDEDKRAAHNHLANFISPLINGVGFREVTVAFVLNGQEETTRKSAAIFESSGYVDRVVVDAVPQTKAGKEREALHSQFLGIEACGRLIARQEENRGAAFDFSVRMRYDLTFRDNLDPWELKEAFPSQLHSFSRLLPAWPIWDAKSQVQILLFQKHYKFRSDNIQRCLPQDVFCLARAAPVASALGHTAAWPFQGNHTLRHHLSGDVRDHYEATLLGEAFDRGARIAVLFGCGGVSCWELTETPAAMAGLKHLLRAANAHDRATAGKESALALLTAQSSHLGGGHRFLSSTPLDADLYALTNPFSKPGATATSNRVPRGVFGSELIVTDAASAENPGRGSWETRRVPVDWAGRAKAKEAERIKVWWCGEKPESILCFAKHKGVYDERGDLAGFRRSSEIEHLKDRKRQKMVDEHDMMESWCGSGKQRMASETCVAFANGPSHREIHGMRAQTIDLSAPVRRRRRRREG